MILQNILINSPNEHSTRQNFRDGFYCNTDNYVLHFRKKYILL